MIQSGRFLAVDKLEIQKRRAETDNGRELPWQALGENAAAQSSAKDLAEALYGIVSKHAEPEDVLYAMLSCTARTRPTRSSRRCRRSV